MKVIFTLKVRQRFVNKEDQSVVYASGDTLTTSELSRVNHLVSFGLCSIESVDVESETEPGTKTEDGNDGNTQDDNDNTKKKK